MLDYQVNCLQEYFMYEFANGAESKFSCADNVLHCIGASSCFGYCLSNMREQVDRFMFDFCFNVGLATGRSGGVVWKGGISENVNLELGYYLYRRNRIFYIRALGDGFQETSRLNFKTFGAENDCVAMLSFRNSIISSLEFKVNSTLESMGFSMRATSFRGTYTWKNRIGVCESDKCKDELGVHNLSPLVYVESVGGKFLCGVCAKSRMIESVSSADKMRRAEREKEKKDKRYISNGLRFSVLDRDNYTCQTCGRSAPTVELEIDHICPWSKGGKTSIENLQALCVDCNRGKSAKIQKGMAVA